MGITKEMKGREEELPQYFPQHNCQMHDCEAVFYWWVLMNKSWPFVVAPYFVETNHNYAKIKVSAHSSYVKHTCKFRHCFRRVSPYDKNHHHPTTT